MEKDTLPVSYKLEYHIEELGCDVHLHSGRGFIRHAHNVTVLDLINVAEEHGLGLGHVWSTLVSLSRACNNYAAHKEGKTRSFLEDYQKAMAMMLRKRPVPYTWTLLAVERLRFGIDVCEKINGFLDNYYVQGRSLQESNQWPPPVLAGSLVFYRTDSIGRYEFGLKRRTDGKLSVGGGKADNLVEVPAIEEAYEEAGVKIPDVYPIPLAIALQGEEEQKYLNYLFATSYKGQLQDREPGSSWEWVHEDDLEGLQRKHELSLLAQVALGVFGGGSEDCRLPRGIEKVKTNLKYL